MSFIKLSLLRFVKTLAILHNLSPLSRHFHIRKGHIKYFLVAVKGIPQESI